MRCDFCRSEDATLEHDARGRATEASCPECKKALRIIDGAMARTHARPMMDQFEAHLARLFPPVTVH